MGKILLIPAWRVSAQEWSCCNARSASACRITISSTGEQVAPESVACISDEAGLGMFAVADSAATHRLRKRETTRRRVLRIIREREAARPRSEALYFIEPRPPKPRCHSA